MSNNTVKEGLEQELKNLETAEILSPSYRKKKLIAYAIRTSIMIGLYIFFWEYIWLRWTLLFYVPLNLLGLGLILVPPYFLKKKIATIEDKIAEIEMD